jgi:hypothetical protein
MVPDKELIQKRYVLSPLPLGGGTGKLCITSRNPERQLQAFWSRLCLGWTPSVVGRAGTPESKPTSVRVDDQTPVRIHGETPLTFVPHYAGSLYARDSTTTSNASHTTPSPRMTSRLWLFVIRRQQPQCDRPSPSASPLVILRSSGRSPRPADSVLLAVRPALVLAAPSRLAPPHGQSSPGVHFAPTCRGQLPLALVTGGHY